MKILMTGGGTAGSVAPLISIYEKLKRIRPDSEFIFITTKAGIPENDMLRGYSMQIIPITCGKFRRYFDLKNISDFFKTFIGFFQSLRIMIKYRPDIVVGTGSFVSVPVVWAAWVNRVKILIHQQDIVASLSNILCINLANTITVTFEKSLRDFPSSKTTWTGNPLRKEILRGDKDKANKIYSLDPDLPLILITGGGTGAQSINNLVKEALYELIKQYQVVLLTGQGKKIEFDENERFKQFEFIKVGMNDLLARADLVISRAGLSTITELSSLSKLSILIPLPKTHQEKNAQYLAEHNAALVLDQRNLTSEFLISKIKKLLADNSENKFLQENMNKLMKKNSADLICEEILKLIKK